MKRGILAAAGAAALFGASAPAAKLLVGVLPPLLLAGLLYLGSGLGLLAVDLVRRARGVVASPVPRGARLRFAAAVVAGGVVAPALLMLGLARTAASTSSLLLNLEGVFTALVAWVAFREHTHARIVIGFLAIAAGGLVLTVDPALSLALSPGALFVVGACACWAVDNNLTQAASSADPVRLAMVKGLAAGATNVILALATGARASVVQEHGAAVAGALVTGFVGYGVSLVLFVLALRHLGTARTGAFFSTAPFVGAVTSLLVLHEAPTVALAVAGGLMGVGVLLHVTERHGHEHVHEPMTHTHEHVHDEHHRHEHAPGVVVSEPHTHEHVHERLVHVHAHAPDIHHRHAH